MHHQNQIICFQFATTKIYKCNSVSKFQRIRGDNEIIKYSFHELSKPNRLCLFNLEEKISIFAKPFCKIVFIQISILLIDKFIHRCMYVRK